MQHTDDRSLKELFGDLRHSVSTLFRKEIELARAETSEKVNHALIAAGSLAAGGMLALAGLIVLLQALVIALTELGLAPALAALIVGGGVAIIAFVLIYKGMSDLKASNLAPTRTVDSLRRDAQNGQGAGAMRNDTDPGSKSAEEVQREVRQSRAEVENALGAIQDRLSPGQMFDQAVAYLRSSGGNEFMRNFGATVRDNPVPVALLGTGLAWLMLARPRPRRPYYEEEDLLAGAAEDDYYGANEYPAGYPASDYTGEYDEGAGFGERDPMAGAGGTTSAKGFAERATETAEAARAKVQGLAEGAGELGRDWASDAKESAQELSAGARAAAERARVRARRAQARAGYYGRRMRRGFLNTLHEQPLVLGAVGLAVGAAIGAALPATDTEDEWMGDARDRLKDRAAHAGREQLAKAGAAAGAAYEAARKEADRQGLTPEGAVAAADSIERKVERVAEAASDAAKTEAQRQKLGQTEDKPV